MGEKIYSFDECIESDSRAKSILMGNGFSIRIHQDFNYSRLLEVSKLDEHLQEIFRSFGTGDFEKIHSYLGLCIKIRMLYPELEQSPFLPKLKQDYNSLVNVLVDAILEKHPKGLCHISEFSEEKARNFLENFDFLFTTNYDLLLYWLLQKNPNKFKDGFRKGTDDYLVWDGSREQNYYFLHGGLHIFERMTVNNERVILKIKSKKSGGDSNDAGKTMIQIVRDHLACGLNPCVVFDGESINKKMSINSNDYLKNAINKFKETQGSLYVFGSRLNPEVDQHIVDAVCDGAFDEIYISLYIQTDEEVDKYRYRLGRANNKEIKFFRSDSVKDWSVFDAIKNDAVEDEP